MNTRLLMIVIATETDVVLVRKRTRRLAELFGFDTQDQTRITTAISELARNVIEYAGGGRVEYHFRHAGPRQSLDIVVRDQGPGIPHLQSILTGQHKSATGMGVGLLGARRLMDEFRVETKPGGGTLVCVGKYLPATAAGITAAAIAKITDRLAADGPADPMEEIRSQNQQIMLQMEELKARQEDLEKLNQELQDTNRGVVALYAELDERADHLRRADELKSKFLSHMSHEFRTPLNSILALSRLLLDRSDGDLTPEQETQVRFMRRAADNLTELVDDLLDLAKVEAGKITVVPAEFTVASIFGALRGMLRPLLVGDAVALIFEDANDLPSLDTDEAKVSQILRNFISNAIKFTERGEVRVTASMDASGENVCFSVRDTGIGIAPGNIELIFQEFGQVAHRLQSRVKGTGLGLPLAKKLAELLHGKITVESTLGQGSSFSVTLPRVYPRPAEPAELQDDWTIDAGRTLVLLIEDEAADAYVIEELLRGSVYQLVTVRSIGQAQKALKQMLPAVILLDVVLLGDESWRLMLKIRQDSDSSDVPLIAISSSGEARKAIHFGADEYLAKPVSKEDLLGLLDRLTGHQAITNVLLIDDEEVSRYVVRQLLPRSRYKLRTATTGEEGWQNLNEQRPDVILLDLNIPDLSGYDFLQRLQSIPAFADIPAIVVTSAVLTPADCAQLQRARQIISKSELSTATLMDAIEDVIVRSIPMLSS